MPIVRSRPLKRLGGGGFLGERGGVQVTETRPAELPPVAERVGKLDTMRRGKSTSADNGGGKYQPGK
jgi:hypothetical protein